jgi:predicted O-methyltransferase YrrM
MTARNARPHSVRHHLFLLRRAAASARFLRHLPVGVLEDAFPGIGDVEITMAHRFRPRGLPHGGACVLSVITAYLQPRRIFEIGTGTGEGTLLMARQAPAARIDTLDLGVAEATLGAQRGDLPLAASEVGEAFRGTPWATRIEQHLGDSATFDFSPLSGKIDLVFVDGAHTAGYVASDSRAAFTMASERGVVVWDDCHLYHPGIGRALLRLQRDGIPIFRVADTRLAIWQAHGSPRTPQAAAQARLEEAPA